VSVDRLAARHSHPPHDGPEAGARPDGQSPHQTPYDGRREDAVVEPDRGCRLCKGFLPLGKVLCPPSNFRECTLVTLR
jgi:hypothetical protein